MKTDVTQYDLFEFGDPLRKLDLFYASNLRGATRELASRMWFEDEDEFFGEIVLHSNLLHFRDVPDHADCTTAFATCPSFKEHRKNGVAPWCEISCYDFLFRARCSGWSGPVYRLWLASAVLQFFRGGGPTRHLLLHDDTLHLGLLRRKSTAERLRIPRSRIRTVTRPIEIWDIFYVDDLLKLLDFQSTVQEPLREVLRLDPICSGK